MLGQPCRDRGCPPVDMQRPPYRSPQPGYKDIRTNGQTDKKDIRTWTTKHQDLYRGITGECSIGFDWDYIARWDRTSPFAHRYPCHCTVLSRTTYLRYVLYLFSSTFAMPSNLPIRQERYVITFRPPFCPRVSKCNTMPTMMGLEISSTIIFPPPHASVDRNPKKLSSLLRNSMFELSAQRAVRRQKEISNWPFSGPVRVGLKWTKSPSNSEHYSTTTCAALCRYIKRPQNTTVDQQKRQITV